MLLFLLSGVMLCGLIIIAFGCGHERGGDEVRQPPSLQTFDAQYLKASTLLALTDCSEMLVTGIRMQKTKLLKPYAIN